MNNTLHTPGPWYVAHHSDIDGGQSIDIRHCCDIPPSTPQIHQIARLPENALANARLIAAAPDLLSALESAFNAIAWDIPSGNLSGQEEEALLDVIRATIDKAKGEA